MKDLSELFPIDVNEDGTKRNPQLNAANNIKHSGWLCLIQPIGQEIARPEPEEIPQHDDSNGDFDTAASVAVQDVVE